MTARMYHALSADIAAGITALGWTHGKPWWMYVAAVGWAFDGAAVVFCWLEERNERRAAK